MLTKRGGEKSPHHLKNNIEARTDITETHFGTTYSSTIKDNSVSYTTGNNTVEYSYTEDENQVNSDSVKYNNSNVITSNYDYDDNGNITEKAMNYQQSKTVTNVYNNKNLIQSTTVGNRVIDYTYDTNNQLVRCDDSLLNYSMEYVYNSRGNLREKCKYKYKQSTNATTYDYLYHNSNPDELTYYFGFIYSYDNVGNMTSYLDDELVWSNGRNLVSYTENALDESFYNSYTYDENGIRTSKTVNGVTTYFNTKDGVILSQTDGTNTLIFQYDTTGTPLGFIWNGTQYFYLTNQMGDVIGITDNQGNELVQYEYNEWGVTSEVTSVHNTSAERSLGYLNPLRYRGYYYDSETGFYYLQSRYYDPGICRFINADSYENLSKNYNSSINFFVYCLNNPIVLSDKRGTDPIIYVYVLYDPDDFERQAKHEKRYWEDNLRYRVVTIKPLYKKKDFIDYWNKTIKTDSIVSMIFHGSPYGIHITSDNFKSGDVNSLNNKRVSQLRILACNCGHKDVENNIAKKIKNRIKKTKTIYVMDGSISYYPKGLWYIYNFYKPRLSNDQSSYYKYALNGRKPTGLYKV